MNFKIIRKPVVVTLLTALPNWTLIKIGLENYGIYNLQLSNYLFLGTLTLASVVGICHQRKIKK